MLLRLTCFIFCTAIGLLFADNSTSSDLDQYIPRPTQRKYGLNLLSLEKRNQIAEWLKAENVKPPTTMTSLLSLNIDNGRYVQLDDGSVWEIAPSMLTTSQGWLSSVQIEVSQTGKDAYPYRLYNTATKDFVYAKRVTMQSITTKTGKTTP